MKILTRKLVSIFSTAVILGTIALIAAVVMAHIGVISIPTQVFSVLLIIYAAAFGVEMGLVVYKANGQL